MDLLQYIINFILHIDQHLLEMVAQYQNWIYLILFLIVFCETGLIVTPFLPGDSLLFALGGLAALPSSGLHLGVLLLLLCIAAIMGDSFNYFTGHKLGSRIYAKDYWFVKRTYIDQTQQFYERYGGRTIIYARFIPIIRTFAPFVAGIGNMRYRRFLYFNIVGALVWVFFFIMAGYLFGNIPAVEQRFSLLILSVIVLSLLPPVIGLVKKWLKLRRAGATL